MKAYLVGPNLVHALNNPEGAMADALDGFLTPDMCKHAGTYSALIAEAVSGDDIASSIPTVSLPDDYMPDESIFPLWPVGTVR